MLKKIIISTLAISIIGGGLYLIKNQSNESKTPQMPETPKVEAKKIIDESTVPKSKTEEERILIKRDYDKGLEFLKNREISKEEKRKEELALTIQYIRDLGFEIDEENHTLSPLILMPDETIINSLGHGYMFKHLKLEELIKLNQYSNEPFLLKLENPIGLDFIIDYKKVENDRLDDDYPMVFGELENIKLENGDTINGLSDINYYGSKFGVSIGLENNKYMPNLGFSYQTIYKSRDGKKLDGITILRIDLDPETGKKIYKRPIPDTLNPLGK